MAPFFRGIRDASTGSATGRRPGGNNQLSVGELVEPTGLRWNTLTVDLDPEDPEAEDKQRAAVERANLRRIEEALASAQEELNRLLRDGRLTLVDLQALNERYRNNFSEVLAEAMRRAARQERSDELQQSWRYAIERTVDDGAAAGLEVAFGQLGNVGISLNYDLLNRFAHDWAQTYSYNLITRIDESTGQQVQHAVSSWMASGQHLDALIRQLEPTFNRNRAEMIAATETTRAFAEGTLLGYRQSGQVLATEWKTAMDQRVCDICGPLHGEHGDLNGNVRHPGGIGRAGRFAGRVFRSPAHVRCRCPYAPVVQAAFTIPVAKPAPVVPPVVVAPPAQPVNARTAEEARSEISKVGQRTDKEIATEEKSYRAYEKSLKPRYKERDLLFKQLMKAKTPEDEAALRTQYEAIEGELRRLLDQRKRELAQKIADLQKERAEALRRLVQVDDPARNTLKLVDPSEAAYAQHWQQGLDAFNQLVSDKAWTGKQISFFAIDSGDRAYYSEMGNIRVAPDEKMWAMVHEIGHDFEVRAGLYPRVRAFYDQRTAGDPLEKLSALTNIAGYRDDEVTRRDKWMNPYIGKDYGKVGSTEIVSVGIQMMYEDPAKFAREDPEMFDFIFNLARGR